VRLKRLLVFTSITAALALGACGGDGGSSGSGGSTTPPGGGTPPPPPVPVSTALDSRTEAARFMIQAGLGADVNALDAMVDSDAASWIQNEFNKPRTNLLTPITDEFFATGEPDFNAHSVNFWEALFGAEDALRMRMTFALSQIFVISDHQVNQTPLATAYYQDILARNAFGNFRDLMEDVTYSPAMADFLTYMYNRKGDPATGRIPDENYAREILQLFTIGLIELNMDGTPKLSGGQPIETYTNDDIRGLARVFTGLAFEGDNFWDWNRRGFFRPLQMYDDYHSELEKSFLGTTIPAGTNGRDSIDQALDAIFQHPNVPPFIARQLIQRFTASDPAPAYVERVANAFADGRYTAPNGAAFGTGQRGDLQATLAAILLDESVHDDVSAGTDMDGKIREPVLKLVYWARTFGVQDPFVTEEYGLYDTSSPALGLSQHPFRPNSVFNFYRPGFVAPGTQAGEAGMTTPEFQIINEGSALGYINFMTEFIFDRTGGDQDDARFTPDYSAQLALADDPAGLVDNLNILMTGGQMTDQEVTALEEIVGAIVTEDADQQARDRVRVAILMIASSASYAIAQ